MIEMSEIKFDLVSTFGFKRDGDLNTHKFEGFHICAVSILIHLRTGFESLPLLSKVILTMNDNAWINLPGFLFSVTLLRTFNSSASMLRNTPQKQVARSTLHSFGSFGSENRDYLLYLCF